MFEELIAAAKAHGGIDFMELGFIEGNERAHHLYEKFGFRVVSEEFMEEGVPHVTMEKQI